MPLRRFLKRSIIIYFIYYTPLIYHLIVQNFKLDTFNFISFSRCLSRDCIITVIYSFKPCFFFFFKYKSVYNLFFACWVVESKRANLTYKVFFMSITVEVWLGLFDISMVNIMYFTINIFNWRICHDFYTV